MSLSAQVSKAADASVGNMDLRVLQRQIILLIFCDGMSKCHMEYCLHAELLGSIAVFMVTYCTAVTISLSSINRELC